MIEMEGSGYVLPEQSDDTIDVLKPRVYIPDLHDAQLEEIVRTRQFDPKSEHVIRLLSDSFLIRTILALDDYFVKSRNRDDPYVIFTDKQVNMLEQRKEVDFLPERSIRVPMSVGYADLSGEALIYTLPVYAHFPQTAGLLAWKFFEGRGHDDDMLRVVVDEAATNTMKHAYVPSDITDSREKANYFGMKKNLDENTPKATLGLFKLAFGDFSVIESFTDKKFDMITHPKVSLVPFPERKDGEYQLSQNGFPLLGSMADFVGATYYGRRMWFKFS